MVEQKSFCGIHHFFYKGNKCPLCEKERIDKLAKKYHPIEKEEESEEKDITDKDIAKLANKFNVIKTKKK